MQEFVEPERTATQKEAVIEFFPCGLFKGGFYIVDNAPQSPGPDNPVVTSPHGMGSDQIGDLYDLLPLGLLVHDPDGAVAYANGVFCELTGYSERDLVGQSLEEQFETIIVDKAVHQNRSSASPTETALDQPVETLLRTASGRLTPVSVQHYPIHGAAKRPAGMLTLVRDLRPLYRKRSLSLTAEFMLEATSAAVGACDVEGTIILANEAARQLLGITGELVGRNVCDVFEAVPPPYDFIRRSLTRGETFENVHTVIPFHGRNLELLINCRRMTDHAGRVLGVCIVGSDVSEVQRLQRVSALGEIAAVLSHELRNPLSVIKGTLQLLARRDDSPSSHLVTAALDEVRRMELIIRDVSSVSQGARAPQLHTLICPTIQRVGNNFRKQLGGDSPVSIELNYVCEKDLDVQGISDHQLSQVLGNLLQNAVEAVGSGPAQIVVDVTEESGYAVIEVSDTGPGIAPEVLPRIFEPFYTTKTAGTGLGLAVCRILVERTGGMVQVQSTPGVGTSFRVSLPLIEAM